MIALSAAASAGLAAVMILFSAASAAHMLGRAVEELGAPRIAWLSLGGACLGASLWIALKAFGRGALDPMDSVALLAVLISSATVALYIVLFAIDGPDAWRRPAMIVLGVVVVIAVALEIALVASGLFATTAATLLRLALISLACVIGVRYAIARGRISHFFVAAVGAAACILAEPLSSVGPHAELALIETSSIAPPTQGDDRATLAAMLAVGVMTLLVGLSSFSFSGLRLIGAPIRGLNPLRMPAAAFAGAVFGGRERPELDMVRYAANIGTGVARDEFDVDFQPQRRMVDGALVGAEALARWRRGAQAGVTPDRFIAAAEIFGGIDLLGDHILQRACVAAARWPRHLHVAVNVSPIQLQNPDFADRLGAALAAADFSPRRLELELTESAFSDESAFDPEILQRLRAKGITISIDDFGRGQSSFARLQHIVVDKIKLDRSLVSEVESSPTTRKIVESIVGLAKDLKIRVTAEGVETIPQLEYHRAIGCDYVQGYGIGRPLPAASFPSASPPWPLVG